MQDQPLVSIVTPSYNQGRFIEEALLSVQQQTYPHIEHIVVDGGSNDETLDVLHKFEGTYNLRWISEPDEGQSQALNKGFRLARGDLLGWLNSDDLYLPRAVELAVDHFMAHPQDDMIYGDYYIVDEHQKLLRRRKEIPFDLNMLIHTFSYTASTTAFFQRRCMHTYQEWLNEQYHYAMDLDFFIRLGKRGCRIAHIPEFMAELRWHNEAKSYSPSQRTRLKEEVREIRARYGLQGPGGQRLGSWALTIGTFFYRAKRVLRKIQYGCYW